VPALPDARVVMVGRVGCHLCDEARAVIARVVAETGDSFAEVDIDADPQLARYTEEVPVTFVDGRQHDYWRVDEGRLRAALQR
jgi:glutaredoxin